MESENEIRSKFLLSPIYLLCHAVIIKKIIPGAPGMIQEFKQTA